MFARTVVVVGLLGLIAFSDNCRAQSDDVRSKQGLPSSYLYSVLNGQKGDKTTFRDSSVRTQGSATQTGNRVSIRDSSGRSIGSAETSGTKTTFRDASGRVIQTATTNGDRTTFRSSSGSNLGTASQSRNNTTFRDSSGRAMGSASSSGPRTNFRDSSGRSPSVTKLRPHSLYSMPLLTFPCPAILVQRVIGLHTLEAIRAYEDP